MSTSKSVVIKIDHDDMKVLVNGGYNLCFAKKVGDSDFNVVWQSYDHTQYMSSNTFSWTPVYQVYGSNMFASSVTVSESCGPQTIGLGQTTTLDQYTAFSSPITGGSSKELTVINQFGPIHLGVSQMCIDITGQQQTTPIYLSEEQFTTGSVAMEPVEQVMVWFESKIATGTMFVDARSNPQIIDMTELNSVTYLYQKGNWVIPGALTSATLPASPLVIALVTTGVVAALDLSSKISSKLTGVYSNLSVEVSNSSGTNYKVTYKTKPGISSAELECARTLLGSNSTIDTLLIFVMQALSALGQGFVSLSANGPGRGQAAISSIHGITPLVTAEQKRLANA